MKMKKRKLDKGWLAAKLGDGVRLSFVQLVRRPREVEGMIYSGTLLNYDVYVYSPNDRLQLPTYYCLVATNREVYTFDEFNIPSLIADMLVLSERHSTDPNDFTFYERALLAFLHITNRWKSIMNEHGDKIKELKRLKNRGIN